MSNEITITESAMKKVLSSDENLRLKVVVETLYEKVKGVSLAGLTKRQQSAMVKHGKHHTGKHIRDMKKRMVKGDSFTTAHKKSQKAVGR